ncbi:hypothetical protein PMSD_25190 [Paenibacillus macquariensis subsp. defensor]|nr:hypothetical protein PMSD_25190 [Paenibacillus macquariensis subsp. defensor]
MPPNERAPESNRQDGVYIIAGGTGGIGLEIAHYLAASQYKNIILIKQCAFPDATEFAAILSKPGNEEQKRIIRTVEDLNRKGCHTEVLSLDITDETAVLQTFEAIRKKYKSIKGIIQAAGRAGDGLIVGREKSKMDRVLSSKIIGTLVLDKATQNDELDFFVLFSSVAVFIPVLGQSDYIAANMFLDAFSAFRNKQNKKTLCVNWAMWKEAGMAVEYGVREATGFHKLLTSEAIEAFDQVLYTDLSNIVVGELNASDLQRQPAVKPVQLSAGVLSRADNEQARTGEGLSSEAASTTTDFMYILAEQEEALTDSEGKVAAVWAEAMKAKEISLYDNFYDLGGNSLLAVHLLRRLDNVFPGIFNISDIFSYPTIFSMAEYLDKRLGLQTEEDDMDILLAKLESGEISEAEAADYWKKG